MKNRVILILFLIPLLAFSARAENLISFIESGETRKAAGIIEKINDRDLLNEALVAATFQGNVSLVQTLLEKNASTGAKDIYGNSVVEIARREYHLKTFHLLVNAIYAETKKSDSIPAYTDFIQSYPGSIHIPDALQRRHDLVLRRSARDFEVSIETTSRNSKETKNLKTILRGIHFNFATQENTIRGYDRFIRRFKKGPYVDQALFAELSLYQKIGTIAGYDEFIGKYPESKLAKAAIQAVAQIYHNKKDFLAYEEFLEKYPRFDSLLPIEYRKQIQLGKIGPPNLKVVDLIKKFRKGVKVSILAAKINKPYRDFTFQEIESLKKMGTPQPLIAKMIEISQRKGVSAFNQDACKTVRIGRVFEKEFKGQGFLGKITTVIKFRVFGFTPAKDKALVVVTEVGKNYKGLVNYRRGMTLEWNCGDI